MPQALIARQFLLFSTNMFIMYYMPHFTYELNGSLYLNITNRCNNTCAFCIKYKNRKFEDKYDLWLTHEPSVQEIINEIKDTSKYRHFVFCGYGEPLIRLDAVKQISKYLKDKGAYVRIDTDGQANIFYGRNVIPELSGLVDELNISLNAQDKELYCKLCRPVFGKYAFKRIIEFAKLAKGVVPNVVFTAVDVSGVDIAKCREIADQIGVGFKTRPYYEKTYTC